MKRIIALVLSLVMVLSFAACAGEKAPAKDPTTKAPATEAPTEAPTEKEEPESAFPEIKERDMTFESFTFKVNGKEVKNDTLADAPTYKITVTTVNSKGNENENTYGGYAMLDVLKAAGVENPTKVTAICSDGYEVEYTIDAETSDWLLVAIEKDKELGENGVWVAPCTDTVSQNYARDVVELKAE